MISPLDQVLAYGVLIALLIFLAGVLAVGGVCWLEAQRPPEAYAMAETRQQYYGHRSRELDRMRKGALCVLYRSLGGLGGKYPPEMWRKDEVISSIVDIEWDRLPADQKKPDPPRLTPPCDTCGLGQNATPHRYGGPHHYAYTHDPDKPWVPESEAEAARLEQLQERTN